MKTTFLIIVFFQMDILPDVPSLFDEKSDAEHDQRHPDARQSTQQILSDDRQDQRNDKAKDALDQKEDAKSFDSRRSLAAARTIEIRRQ